MENNGISNNGALHDENLFLGKDFVPLHYNNVDAVPTSNQHSNVKYSSNKKQEFSIEQKGDKKEGQPVTVFDVAKYVLEKLNTSCTTMKLQKLVYYCQAWYLVWEDKPLFKEEIEAWANGPVVRSLFNFHQGMYSINKYKLTLGNSSHLSKLQREDIDSVLEFYGSKTSQWLIDQTHSEQPWITARKGLAPYERGEREISLESMVDYYSSLK